MTDSESEREGFTETDDSPTQMGYGSGGVPLYVALLWMLFLASYIAYMLMYGLPDLSGWEGP